MMPFLGQGGAMALEDAFVFGNLVNKFDDFNFYTVSPYFENNNRDDISLINPSNNLNQYGNYSLFD